MSTDDSRSRAIGHVGILSHARLPIASRLSGLITALAARNLIAEPVVYADDVAQEVSDHLLRLDGVLVWVDPIVEGQDRSRLDEMLREVASRGVWVSAHPDVILKMGTKDVLVSTRQMGWGTDCHLYRTGEELKEQLPGRLASGPRVLKQHRGNGGNGVWKVELVRPADAVADALVQVLHAQRGSAVEDMRLGEFIGRCEQYFKGSGCMIDQPYQERLGDGMIRCYLVQDRVAGFTHQFTRGLMPPPPQDAGPEATLPGHGNMYGASEPAFQPLRAKMESDWVPEMQRLLDLDVSSLPAIWDADFLYGPKTASGEDTYVLCEINVSAVFPFPDDAYQPLADAVARMLSAGPVGRWPGGRRVPARPRHFALRGERARPPAWSSLETKETAVHKLALGIGLILVAVGIVGYIGSGMASWTALIRSVLGLIIAGLGGLALWRPGARKHAMHAAAAVALLGFLGAIQWTPAFFALLGGAAVNPWPATAHTITAILTAIFVAAVAYSFIQARRASAGRPAE